MITLPSPMAMKAASYAGKIWRINGSNGYGCIVRRFGTFAQTQEEWTTLPMHYEYFDISDPLPLLVRKVAGHINSFIDRADLYFTPNVFSKERRLKVYAMSSKWLYCDSDNHTLTEYEALGLLPNIHVRTSDNSFMDMFRLTEAITPDHQQQLNTAIVNALKSVSRDNELNNCGDSAHYFRLICTTNFEPKYRRNGIPPCVSDYEKPRRDPYTLNEIMGILKPYLPPENASNGIQGFHRGDGFSGLSDPAYLQAVQLYADNGGNPDHVKLLTVDHYIKKGELADRSLTFSQMVNDLLYRLNPVLEPRQEGLTLSTVQAIAEVCPLNKRIPDGNGTASAINYAEKEIAKQHGKLMKADKLLTHDEFKAFRDGTA